MIAKTTMKLLLLLLLSCFLYSCALKPLVLLQPECGQIELKCEPKKWIGAPYDTSREAQQLSKRYYDFQCLKNLNTKSDEWAISFINEKDILVTNLDGDRQYVMAGRMDNDLSGRIISGVGIPLDGNVGSFSAVGKDLVFACSNDDDKSITGNSNLYTGKISANIIFDVQKLPAPIYYNEYVWTSQPSLSEDKSILFFSSDRPSGLGGTDIWFSILLEDGRWSKPINCGDSVNSKCDELTPFLTKDGKQLYFASSGFESVGGYDIFVSEISDSLWKDVSKKEVSQSRVEHYFSKCSNLRPPLNTPADELFPTCPGDCNDLLYYSSNQFSFVKNPPDDKGGFDLFVRRRIIRKKDAEVLEEMPAIAERKDSLNVDVDNLLSVSALINPIFNLEGKVLVAKKLTPIPNAEIQIKPVDKELLVKQSFEKYKTDLDGSYSFTLEKGIEYELTAQARNYFFDSYKLLVEITDTLFTYIKNFYIPEILTLRVNFPTDVYDAPYKYTLDSNGVETDRSWEEELDLIAQNIIESKDEILKIKLLGHTDDVGSVEYNQQLGKRRVDFVVEQLIKRGVPEELLEASSAGKLEPLQRRNKEGLSAFRKRLRRVEMQKITK